MGQIVKKQRIVSLIIMCFLFTALFPFHVFAGIMPEFEPGEGVYLLDPDTGETYVKQNENQTYYPASTTKVLTALTAMDVIGDRLDERVTIGPEITLIDTDSSVAALKEGDTYTWKELLYAMLLPSGNDAAMTIAVQAARLKDNNAPMTESEALSVFSEMMNAKATEIGAVNSHFVNPHGLMDFSHYTTPTDMTKIALKAFENSVIAEIAKTAVYTCTSGNGTAQEWQNTNVLIQPSAEKMTALTKEKLGISDNNNPFYSPYASSGKTGYVEEAGRCLVFTGENGEMKLIGVIFGASDLLPINSQAKQALETAVTAYSHVELAEPYTKVTMLFAGLFSGFRLTLSLGVQNRLTVPTAEKDQLNAEIEWNAKYCKDKGNYITINADFEAGTPIAVLHVYGPTYDNRLPLYAQKGVKAIGLSDYLIIGVVILTMAALIFYVVIQVKYKKMHRRKNKMRRIHSKR